MSPIYSCLAYVSATFIATFLVPKELSFISRFSERTKDYSIQMIFVTVKEMFSYKFFLELSEGTEKMFGYLIWYLAYLLATPVVIVSSRL